MWTLTERLEEHITVVGRAKVAAVVAQPWDQWTRAACKRLSATDGFRHILHIRCGGTSPKRLEGAAAGGAVLRDSASVLGIYYWYCRVGATSSRARAGLQAHAPTQLPGWKPPARAACAA